MREETARWLEPLLAEHQRRGDGDFLELIQQATMPAAEADHPVGDWMAGIQQDANAEGDTGLRFGAVDWIRLGQLLIERYGWQDYPPQPDAPPEALR